MATHYPVADSDYAEHLQTYRSFVRGVMFFVATMATILILLAYFLL
ncbi:aa3-type cytochrome c oxidase subunit IV [Hyphomicrobium sp. CS1GBMeth3]|nr:aa3-type cytochrome c oxidase subunit IV [Hyphomicrobium sp. CS1GBMeth3]